jgi:hypothetical protein
VSPESPTATGSRSPAAWLTWAAASGAALLFVLLLGSNVPYWDEWELVPAITGHQPITFDFLWSLHNEHRIPLGRLVYLGLFALTHDFRAGMVFDVLALSAAGALLIETARRVRGRGAWVDGVFALLLLNPGHAENLLWSFQIPIVLIPVLLAVALSAAARMGVQPTAADVIGVAVPMALSPLCGAPGVVLATVTGGWLIWLCFRSRRWLLPGALGLLCWAIRSPTAGCAPSRAWGRCSRSRSARVLRGTGPGRPASSSWSSQARARP